VNSKFTFCMQLHSCKWRSKAGGNLAEEKKLLSLAWCGVGSGLGSLPEAGGGVCGGVGAAADTGEGRKQKWWC